MEEIGFDGIEAHRKQHDDFRAKIRSFIEQGAACSRSRRRMICCGEVFEYLQEWWKVHITVRTESMRSLNSKTG